MPRENHHTHDEALYLNLGSYLVKEDCALDYDFNQYSIEVWKCKSCGSILYSIYLDSMGSSSRDMDHVKCPICEYDGYTIYSACFAKVEVLIERENLADVGMTVDDILGSN